MSSDDDWVHYAYGEDRAGVETVMRLHAVKRWHMIDTTRVQTLAEHSANVATLVYGIAKTCPGMIFGPANTVAGMALLHDIDEVFTGDIPTHTKRMLTGVKELEAKITPSIFKESGLTVGQQILIKLCDLADGIRFIRLHGVDVTARHAREGLERQLEAKKKQAWDMFPEAVYEHISSWIMFYAYEMS